MSVWYNEKNINFGVKPALDLNSVPITYLVTSLTFIPACVKPAVMTLTFKSH